MNYIVFDLEFNQKYNNPDNSEGFTQTSSDNKSLTFEIIQIGAVKLNENFEELSTFNALVKPVVHKTLHPYVERMTKIDINKANASLEFPEIYSQFLEFIKGEKNILCVWGSVDIKELLKNMKFHNIKTDDFPEKYIDVQLYTSKLLKFRKGTRAGLQNSLELLDIEHSDGFHNAFMDAYYTSLIFKKVYTNKFHPADCLALQGTPARKKTTNRLDSASLISQFEKMYNRKLTDEETKMIIIAYTMGYTRQFQTNKPENRK